MDSGSFQISAWETGSPYKASRHNVRKVVGRSSIESSNDQYADDQFEDDQGSDGEDNDEISPDDLLGGDNNGEDMEALDIDAAFEQFASAENIVPLNERADAMIFEDEQQQEESDEYGDDYDNGEEEEDDDDVAVDAACAVEPSHYGGGDGGEEQEEEEAEDDDAVDPNVDILGLINEYDCVMGEVKTNKSPTKTSQGHSQAPAPQFQYRTDPHYDAVDDPDPDEDDDDDALEQGGEYDGRDHEGEEENDAEGVPSSAGLHQVRKVRRKEYIGLSKSAVKSSGYGPAPLRKVDKKSAERVKNKLRAMKEAQQEEMLRRREEQMELFLQQQVRRPIAPEPVEDFIDEGADDQYLEFEARQTGAKSKSKANSKHRLWLEEVAEKRRAEDEALQRQVELAALKRKKFKEALLEKALRSREENADREEDIRNQLTGEVLPTFLAPTKAFKVQQMPKKLAPVEVPAEEVARLEQEKLEQVTKIRRKFKEQHKMLLQQLSVKNEQLKQAEAAAGSPGRKKTRRPAPSADLSPGPDPDMGAAGSGLAAVRSSSSSRRERHAAASEEEMSAAEAETQRVLKAQRKKEKRERKLRDAAMADVMNGVDDDEASPSKRAYGGRQKAAPVGEDATNAKKAPQRRSRTLTDDGEAAGGAGAAEEPKRSKSVKAPNSRLYNPAPPSVAPIAETAPAADPEAAAAAAVLSLAKHSEYLKSIADARRQEEADKLKKEERVRRRMVLLRERVLKEAVERKQMAAEDRVRVVIETTTKPAKKVRPYVRPVPPPKKEADGDSNEEEAAKPVRKPPVTRRTVTKTVENSDSSGSNDSSDSSDEDVVRKKKPARGGKKPSSLGDSTLASTAYTSNYQARDFMDWKRKNGVAEDTKVFVMTGWYPCVKDALIERGWVENPDRDSPFADLKWTLRSIDVNKETLQPWQLTNHFMKNMAITTKAGLIKSLSTLTDVADVHANDIIPRGYDLSAPAQMRAFIDDFRCQQAEIVLRAVYKRVTGLDNPLTSAPTARPPTAGVSSSSRPSSAAANICSTPVSASRPGTPAVWTPLATPTDFVENPDTVMVNKAVFSACCSIIEKLLKLHDFDDMYLDDLSTFNNVNNHGNQNGANYGSVLNNNGFPDAVVSALEWELVSYSVFDATTPLADKAQEPVDGFLQGEAEKEFIKEHITSSKAAKQYEQYQIKEAKRVVRAEQAARTAAAASVAEMVPLTESGLSRVHSLLSKLRHYLHKAQANLAGTEVAESKNMWIVKPAAKSRGRGITTFGDLDKLLKYVEAGNGLSTQWVVQKYMENSLTICKRKFDLRQWVLVTDWNPLTVYFYDECYARFSIEEYTTEENNFQNSFVHLVNNSIGKDSENHGRTFTTPDGDVIEGFMMGYEGLTKYFKSQYGGRDIMKEVIAPRMKDIARWSLQCASEMIEHRKNSWELYGFDYMVDTDLNTWLIEINSSPACDYSTKTTERYVQRALVDILSVVLDTREYSAMPKKERERRGVTKPDTGGWDIIYKGPLLEKPAGSFGAEFGIKGDAIKLPVRRNINFDSTAGNSASRLSEPRKAAGGGGGSGGEKVFAPKEVSNKENVRGGVARKTAPISTAEFTISQPETSPVPAQQRRVALNDAAVSNTARSRASFEDSLGDSDGDVCAAEAGFSDSDCESVGQEQVSVKYNRVVSTEQIATPPQPHQVNVSVEAQAPYSSSNRTGSRGRASAAASTVPVQKQVMYTKGQAVSAISMKTFTMDL